MQLSLLQPDSLVTTERRLSGTTERHARCIAPGRTSHQKSQVMAKELDRFPQLDSLRAFAVLAVMATHWLPREALSDYIEAGTYGVRLFFVLSGFLITRILLQQDIQIRSGRISRAFGLKQFYARRTLRIFPLFYFVLITAAILNAPGIREQLAWHATYMSNVYFSLHGMSGRGVHFWSLAVEEQFYLLWPAILFLFRRSLKQVLFGMVLVGPVWRFVAAAVHAPSEVINTPLFANIDSLALGALLALEWSNANDDAPDASRFATAALVIGLPLTLIAALTTKASPLLHTATVTSGASFLFVWLVDGGSRGFGGKAGALLSWKPLRYIGKISYGLYVYHLLTPFFLRDLLLGERLDGMPVPVQAIILLLFTMAVAAVSWHFFEAPINNLKKYFPYSPTRRPRPRALEISIPR